MYFDLERRQPRQLMVHWALMMHRAVGVGIVERGKVDGCQ